MSELIGKTVGQYQIVEKIGAGGMAAIFKAYQPSIDRYVAIKILPDQLAEDENFVKRFAHEAKAIAALEHPHILPVHDFGTEGKLNYMVMRYVKGGTLSGLMGKPIPYQRVVKIVSDVGRALDYAHERGVVHRDIKPSNILLDEHGEVLLTDFGIAKMVESSKATQLTAAGSILGTPAYMSPEQAQGHDIDGRSDIYSLGVVLYELLTGSPPYEAETPFAIVLKHINDPLPPPRSVNPDIPEALERIVLKAMSKNRTQRFESARQMVEALQNALKEIEGTLVVPASSSTPSAPGTLREKAPPTASLEKTGGRAMGPIIIGGAVAIVLLCVLAGGGLVMLGLFSSSDESATAITPTSTFTRAEIGNNNQAEPTEELAAAAAETSTSTPIPTEEAATPTPPAENNNIIELGDDIVFAEDFNAAKNGWFIGRETDEYGEYSGEISDSRYRLFVRNNTEDGHNVWFEPDRLELDNFEYSVDALSVEHNETSFTYGLTFRSDSEGNYYLFEVDDAGYSIWKASTDSDWEELVEFTPTELLSPDSPNQLMVRASGPILTFFINGEEVDEIENHDYSEGTIGLFVAAFDKDGELTVEFDNVVVRSIEGEESFVEDEIIFADSFDSDANGWSTGAFEDEYSENEVTIADGKFTFSVTSKPDQTPYIEKVLPNQEFSDFVLNVQAAPVDDAEHYSYGIAFRENFAGHTYAFEIGNDGLYAVFLFDGEWSVLKDWSQTDAILPGEANEIMVIAEGEEMTFIVNGQILTTLEDDTLSEGGIGLVIELFEPEVSATVDFDNLEVRTAP